MAERSEAIKILFVIDTGDAFIAETYVVEVFIVVRKESLVVGVMLLKPLRIGNSFPEPVHRTGAAVGNLLGVSANATFEGALFSLLQDVASMLVCLPLLGR